MAGPATTSQGGASPDEPILRIRDLRVRFRTPGRRAVAVAGVDLDVGHGEIVGIVGETGCGKTVTGLSVLGLLPDTAEVEAEELRLLGRDLLALSDNEWRDLRGRDVAMVFQNPTNSFNPVFTIGAQMRHVLAEHEGSRGAAADARIGEVLTACAMPDPERVMQSYPHQLSGGMLQRAMLGLALLSRPKLLIADEPTTALDVTIAAQIPRSPPGAAAGDGLQRPLHHARPGRGSTRVQPCGSAVRGPGGRDGQDGQPVRVTPASLHARAHRGGAAHTSRRRHPRQHPRLGTS